MGVSLKIGIDLGTTNSCIAYFDGKRTQVLTLQDGRKTLPSCVMYDKGRVVVGRKAYENRFLTNQVVYSTKRDIGTNKVYQINDGLKEFTVTPVEVSAEILKELKGQIEKKFQSVFSSVVITVPAYFNDSQKKDTLRAGKLAGFEYVRLLAEPSAAALAYTGGVKKPERAVVYDLGGGTFDVSLIDILPADQMLSGIFEKFSAGMQKVATVQVLEIDGNNRLGGDDFDYNIFKELCKAVDKEAKEKYGISGGFSFARQVSAQQREKLLLDIESTKKMYKDGTTFGIPVKCNTGAVAFDYHFTINESVLEKGFSPIFLETIQRFDRVISKSKCKPSKIILIGGSTKFQKLRDMLRDLYPDMNIYDTISPDFSVAIGAATMAASDDNIAPIKLHDIVPQNIGIQIEQISMGVQRSDIFKVIIPKSAQIPASFSTSVETEFPEQTEAAINIYEGDSMIASENACLGSLVISGIVPSTKRTPIHVTLSVDINGLLQVSAKQNGILQTAELVNVIKSDNRITGETKDLESKKQLRFMRLLEKFSLSAAEQKVVNAQVEYFADQHRFMPEFIEVVKKYQQINKAQIKKQQEAIFQEESPGSTHLCSGDIDDQ